MDYLFEFDEIGYWSELKLDIIEKYGSAYTRAFLKTPSLKKYYIDGFSGAGSHLSKSTGLPIEGSPTRALKIDPPFDKFYFIDMDPQKTNYLQTQCVDRSDVTIHTGDSSAYLTQNLLPNIQYENYNRALCLLDPYGLHLDWDVIRMAGKSRAIDLFLNFPVMDMNRNAIWRDPQRVKQEGIIRMNRFWGDDSWRTAAYAEAPQMDLFDQEPKLLKQPNDAIAAAFAKRLKEVAGFRFVAEPLPMKNSNNAIVYYLFFACKHPVAEKIIKAIFKKYQ